MALEILKPEASSDSELETPFLTAGLDGLRMVALRSFNSLSLLA